MVEYARRGGSHPQKRAKDAFAITFGLLTTSEGIKMGKTAKGAVWLDPDKTAPYDFFQYWRNIADADVEKVFRFLTFVPLDEIAELTRYNDERMNKAKERLAYELTKMVHGEKRPTTLLQRRVRHSPAIAKICLRQPFLKA